MIKIVLLIESYPEIQKISKQLPKNIKLITCKDIPCAQKVLTEQKVDLLIVNQKTEDDKIYTFLQSIRFRNPKIKLFAILPDNRRYINNCIISGLNDYIERSKYKVKCIVCRIEKLINLINEYALEIHSKGKIYLNADNQAAYISGKKIDLTESETRLLVYMLQNDRYCSIDELKIHLSGTKEKCIRVLIYRLMKKMRYILGYSVIKNKYRKGYCIEY